MQTTSNSTTARTCLNRPSLVGQLRVGLVRFDCTYALLLSPE